MDPSRNGKNRVPLGDVTNTTTQDHDTVGQRLEEEDPKARKRRMDRERLASMSAEKRNEQNKRRRERRMEKKVRIVESEPTEKHGGDQDNDYQDSDDMQPYKETPDGSEIISQQPDEADETDYMNMGTAPDDDEEHHDTVGQRPGEEDPKARKRRMDRERLASMSAEKRNEHNRRRRERRMEKNVRIDESEPTEKHGGNICSNTAVHFQGLVSREGHRSLVICAAKRCHSY